MFDDEMMKALEADGEKLKALTGQDHGPHFIPEQPCEVCETCNGVGGWTIHGVGVCPACNGTGKKGDA